MNTFFVIEKDWAISFFFFLFQVLFLFFFSFLFFRVVSTSTSICGCSLDLGVFFHHAFQCDEFDNPCWLHEYSMAQSRKIHSNASFLLPHMP